MVPTAAAAPPFEAFGTAHFAALGCTLLLASCLIYRARRHPGKTERQDKTLALFLLALFPAQLAVGAWTGVLNKETALPCQLCDVAALLGAAALWFRHQRLAELVWFWGLAGTMNGLITPALSESFPSLRFLSFFALHGGVVIAAVYLVAGLGLRPQPGALWRAIGWLQVYLLMAVLVNFLTGANYGFLREKPAQATLLDVMGPWPWYIIGLEILALILFTLLHLPFHRRAPAE